MRACAFLSSVRLEFDLAGTETLAPFQSPRAPDQRSQELHMNVIGISGVHRSVAFKEREFPGLTRRQYRIAQGFDSAAALVGEGGVVAAAAEERFTREKATGDFPVRSIQ